MSMLEVNDLHVYYGSIHAVKGVSFTVDKGEIVTLIGANGAGKSTTLNTIAGILPARRGSVEFQGEGILGVPAHKMVRKGIALCPEGRRVFTQMTVEENLQMGGYTRTDAENADTMEDVYQKFHAAVAEVKNTSELDSEFDGVAKLLGMIPGVVLKFVVWLLKLLDYFGLLPRFLLEVSPFHGSVFFTSMGSLGIPAIYHHLYNFGNLPVFCAFGCKRREKELDSSGQPVDRKYIDYSFTLDERTCDGFYYATAFKHFRRLLQHPEQLEQAPDEIIHDIP